MNYHFELPPNSGMWDVKADFGAVGDGLTDDTQAFLAAFRGDSAAFMTGEREGGIRAVYIPAGTYLISKPLPLGDKKKMVLGEGKHLVTLRLAPNSPDFQDPQNPVPFIDALGGQFQAQNFFMFIKHLTIEIGAGNPGAIGLFFHTNNSGAVFDVNIRALDGQTGKTGLQLRNWPGPGMIKHVGIEGFETGILVSDDQYSMTFEDVTIRNARSVAFQNNGNTCSVRKLKVENCPSGFVGTSATSSVTLIDCEFDGPGTSAITRNAGFMIARNIAVSGYIHSISSGSTTLTGPVDEWLSHPVKYLFPAEPRTIGLPIAETPEMNYPPASSGTHVVLSDNGDNNIAPEFQAAIDAGFETIYIPATWGKSPFNSSGWTLNQTVMIRNNLKRIMGLGVVQMNFLTGPSAPAFRVQGANADTIFIEHIYANYGTTARVGLEHAQANTLVIRGGDIDYENTVAGATLFTESTVGKLDLDHATVWNRDLNTEQVNRDNVVLRHTNLWTLGHKTERNRVVYLMSDSSRVELLGGLIYNNRTDAPFPMMKLDSTSEGTFSYRNKGTPYLIMIEQDRYGVQRRMTASRSYSNAFPLFSAYIGGAPREPFDLTLLGVSARTVDFGWTDLSANETGYIIQRGPNTTTFTSIDTVGPDIFAYQDTTVSANTTYYYRVLAYNAVNTSLTEYTPRLEVRTSPASVAALTGDWFVRPEPGQNGWLLQGTPLSAPGLISIHDLQGRRLAQEWVPPGTSNWVFSLPELASGLYLLRMESGNSLFVREKIRVP